MNKRLAELHDLADGAFPPNHCALAVVGRNKSETFVSPSGISHQVFCLSESTELIWN